MQQLHQAIAESPIDRGVYLDVVDFDHLFRTLSHEPIIVNEFDMNSTEDRERLNELRRTRYEGDTLDILPSCDGGHITGEYNVGIRCPECKTLVLPVTEKPLESTLWMQVPKGVKAFVNPAVWSILTNAFRVSGFDVVEWLCNTTYKPNKGAEPALKKLSRFNLPARGLNSFVNNFDDIFEILLRANVSKLTVATREQLEVFIQNNRQKIFCEYLPVPSRLAFVIESSASWVSADTSMKGVMDAILTITSVESSTLPLTQRVREIRTVKAIVQLAEYYQTFFKDSAGTKYGWFRKHIFGSRLHFTFRAVISSLSANHDYDEIHLPWSMAVMAFKIHLTSKLLGRGFTPNEVTEFLYEHTLKYHPLLDEIFKELIAEAPMGGIPCIFARNPTLQRGSMQRMRITVIKDDPEINTVSMSVLALKAPNADYDGRLIAVVKPS